MTKSSALTLLYACALYMTPVLAENRSDLVQADEVAIGDAGKRDTELKVRAGGGQGGTAIHWMAFNGDVAGVSQQIISGANIDARLDTGGTPLHLAAYKGHTKVVRLLVEHGAKVNARTKAGVTPLDWARRNGHQEVARLLKAYGAKSNKTRQTPLTGSDNSGRSVSRRAATSSDAPRPVAPKKYSLMGLEDSDIKLGKPQGTDNGRIQKPVSTGGYRIQLGAFATEKRAIDAWSIYSKRFPEFLDNRELILDKVVVNGKTFHRVQTGPIDRAEAWRICGELKKAGQSCAVMTRGPS